MILFNYQRFDECVSLHRANRLDLRALFLENLHKHRLLLMKTILQAHRGKIKSESVLDVGPTIKMPITSAFVSSKIAVCIDISPEGIKKTKETTPVYECLLANCETLPFATASFDFLYAGQVIEHLNHPEWFLQETYRVLQPQGYMLIDTPNSNVTRVMNVVMRTLLGRELGPADHVTVFSYKETKDALYAQGFRIVGSYGLYLPLTLFLPIPFLTRVAMVLGYKFPRASFLNYFLVQK